MEMNTIECLLRLYRPFKSIISSILVKSKAFLMA